MASKIPATAEPDLLHRNLGWQNQGVDAVDQPRDRVIQDVIFDPHGNIIDSFEDASIVTQGYNGRAGEMFLFWYEIKTLVFLRDAMQCNVMYTGLPRPRESFLPSAS